MKPSFSPLQSSPPQRPLAGAGTNGLDSEEEGDKTGLPRTMVWQVDSNQPDMATIFRAADMLARGGVIIYPTETYFGLGGDPTQAAAVRRIFTIKGRAFNKPLPLIAADREAVFRAVANWPPAADSLAGNFWPGPLTLILQASPSLLPLVHAQTGKIAVRISSHPVARSLASAIGGLLTATSANASGQPAFRTCAEMPRNLLAQVDGFLNVDCSLPGTLDLPSTIVDLCGAVPLLVRPGCIPWEDVLKVLRAEGGLGAAESTVLGVVTPAQARVQKSL